MLALHAGAGGGRARAASRGATSIARQCLRAQALDPQVTDAQGRVAKEALGTIRGELSATGFFGLASFLPVDRDKLTGAFASAAALDAVSTRRALIEAFTDALPTLSAERLAAVAVCMARAGLAQPEPWSLLEEAAILEVRAARLEGRALAELAWAFAYSGQGARAVWAALRAAEVTLASQLTEQERKVLGWAHATAGPRGTQAAAGAEESGQASEAATRGVWAALDHLAAEGVVEGPTGAELQVRRLHGAGAGAGLPVGDSVPILEVRSALTPYDAEQLIRMADEGALWRGSEELAGARPIGRRTSESAQLNQLRHVFTEPVMRVRSWVAYALQVPDKHIEGLQLVRYSKGQRFARHMDWSPAGDPDLWISGQRVATVLMYLNTLPEGCGGQTVFDELGVSVTPELGKAILWPNVDRQGMPEPLTAHEAMPVTCDEPTKYMMNVWIRERPQPDRTWIGWR